MTRPLSVELREKIVNAYKKGLGSTSKIAQMFSVTQRTVSALSSNSVKQGIYHLYPSQVDRLFLVKKIWR